MAHANTDPRSETVQVDGHVLTHGCRYRPDLQRWEPVASVRPAWNAKDDIPIPTRSEDLQDTPEDAMQVAQNMVEQWLKANPAPTS